MFATYTVFSPLLEVCGAQQWKRQLSAPKKNDKVNDIITELFPHRKKKNSLSSIHRHDFPSTRQLYIIYFTVMTTILTACKLPGYWCTEQGASSPEPDSRCAVSPPLLGEHFCKDITQVRVQNSQKYEICQNLSTCEEPVLCVQLQRVPIRRVLKSLISAWSSRYRSFPFNRNNKHCCFTFGTKASRCAGY